jgi:hypothetical protein
LLSENKRQAKVDSPLTIDSIFNSTSLLTRQITELSEWDTWVSGLKESVADLGPATVGKTAEAILKKATMQVEAFVSASSALVSPTAMASLLRESRETILNQTLTNDLVEIAKTMAMVRGLDVTEAVEKAKAAAAYAANLTMAADSVYLSGYVAKDTIVPTTTTGSRALFADYPTATQIDRFSAPIAKAAEMGALSGAIYEQMVPRTLALGHSIVAEGITDDVKWMVTDSIATPSSFKEEGISVSDTTPLIVRTITIRGFDASDPDVDRELLLNRLCAARPESFKSVDTVLAHRCVLSCFCVVALLWSVVLKLVESLSCLLV